VRASFALARAPRFVGRRRFYKGVARRVEREAKEIMMKYTIGRRNGRKITAEYSHAAGSAPTLVIREQGQAPREFTGNSLGPANYLCDPTADDLSYWQSIADLPADEVLIRRSLAARAKIVERWQIIESGR
jgi:hypothetical protein